ncbi:PREDICTED: FMRFamide-activated amiloride-sensitive sodium channel-like [Priapulus caudatus]|uniref:FMRFamide-activated amiloride-sensitive sodium channel-like n=1 Tax=Priapulus caudatus TaxID=37621 RepID=A0ABM1DVL2_PRICU|nr:PREDICTED: FMRFamide-activated amiloride-sensitive sodium channel-like [Priapulus caudatus]XP_014663984.1 PREDICTED: FMRFamide-activated amiloride-sensitive sodium channel-like [Priapulus caudatus]
MIAKWPSNAFLSTVAGRYNRQHSAMKLLRQQGTDGNDGPVVSNYGVVILDNIAKIQIYFSDLSVEHIQQSAYIKFTPLVSNIGGTLGLWVGISILALFEFLELVYDLAVYGCNSLCGKKKSQNGEQQETHKTTMTKVYPLDLKSTKF